MTKTAKGQFDALGRSFASKLMGIASPEERVDFIRSNHRDFSPQLCVDVAEALTMKGCLLPAPALAKAILEHAYRQSPKHGAYGLGRHTLLLGDGESAIRYFNISARLLHVPSGIVLYSHERCRPQLWRIPELKLRLREQ